MNIHTYQQSNMSRRYKIKKDEQSPIFVCQHCGERTRLKFHPIVDYESWSAFKCPKCKKSRLI